MALYKGQLGLAEAFAAPLPSDRADGCGRPWWSTSTARRWASCIRISNRCARRSSRARGVYHSRSRGLWVKGATSGAVQELLRIDADCDRDCLRFTVRQQPPGFCHRDTRTCWGPDRGLGELARRLATRRQAAPPGSYTASCSTTLPCSAPSFARRPRSWPKPTARDHVIHEAADVLYFTLATLARHGVELAEVEAALDRRALKVTRRD